MTYYETWTESAACREIDGDMWFPETGDNAKDPRSICMFSCSVRDLRLNYAMRKERGLSHSLRHGIYGGLSPNRRAAYEAEWLAGQVAA